MAGRNLGSWAIIDAKVRMVFQATPPVRTPELRDVAQTFRTNLTTATSLCDLPHIFFVEGQFCKLCELSARQTLFGDIYSEPPSERHKEYSDLLKEIKEGRAPTAFPHVAYTAAGDLDRAVPNSLFPVLDSLASAQLLLAWTSFETMAGDLWEQAVNAHPKQLAALDAKKLPRKDGDEGKTLPMKYFGKYGYNLEKHMGTILRDQRFTFQKLKDIRDAYLASFPETCDPGRKSYWDNHGLKAACALRNVIAHRAGVFDEEFINNRGPHPSVARWKEGEKFAADGCELQVLIKDFAEFCVSLIASVDQWIVDNPM